MNADAGDASDVDALFARLALDPGDPAALRGLARLLPDPVDAGAALAQAMMRLLDEERFVEAVDVVGELMTRDPSHPTLMELVAPRLYAAQAWAALDATLDRYAAALEGAGAQDGGGWRMLAGWRERRGDDAAAAAAAARALALDPHDGGAALMAAAALARLNHPDALPAARRAAALTGDHAMLRLAATLAGARNDPEALADARRWVDARPDDCEALFWLVRVAEKSGDVALRRSAVKRLSLRQDLGRQELKWLINHYVCAGEWRRADLLTRRLAAMDADWAPLHRPIPGDRPGDMVALTARVRAALDAPEPPPPPGACSPRAPWKGRRAAFLVNLHHDDGEVFEGALRQQASAAAAGVPLSLHDESDVIARRRSASDMAMEILATGAAVVLVNVNHVNLDTPLPDVALTLRRAGVKLIGLAYDLWGDAGRATVAGWGRMVDRLVGFTPAGGVSEGADARVRILMAPMAPSRPEADLWGERDIACVFSGRLLADRAGWLAGAMAGKGSGAILAHIVGLAPPQDQDAYLAMTRRARSVLSLARRTTGEKIFTGRSAETLTCGAVLLQESNAGVDWFYHEHRHYLSFSCVEELALSLRFVDEQPTLARDVARAGMAFFDRAYGPVVWWEMLAGALED